MSIIFLLSCPNREQIVSFRLCLEDSIRDRVLTVQREMTEKKRPVKSKISASIENCVFLIFFRIAKGSEILTKGSLKIAFLYF